MIFMQEKLAEMKSKYMTQVAIRVKPISDQNVDPNQGLEELATEPFSILNSGDMGLAKQIIIHD